MSIPAVSASNPYYQAAAQAAPSRASDFKSLAQSLASGDLAGAQQAFAALQQGGPNQANPVSAVAPTAPSGPAADIQTLGKALAAGDITAAQQAFAKLQQDGQAVAKAHGGGHHHHHAGAAPAPAPAPTPAAPVRPDATGGPAAIGSTISVKV